MEVVLLWLILLAPLAVGLVFRVGAPHIFFSLMAGELLARYFGEPLQKSLFSTSQNSAHIGEIVLLVLPMILTALFMKKSVRSGSLVLHIIPYAITGFVLAAFLLPLLSDGLQGSLSRNIIAEKILSLNHIIIGVVVVAQLVSLWLFSRSKHHE